MEMRLRIPELLHEKGISFYRVANESGDRISMSTIYRLKKANGRLGTYNNALLEALCDVLRVEPGELWERDKPRRR